MISMNDSVFGIEVADIIQLKFPKSLKNNSFIQYISNVTINLPTSCSLKFNAMNNSFDNLKDDLQLEFLVAVMKMKLISQIPYREIETQKRS